MLPRQEVNKESDVFGCVKGVCVRSPGNIRTIRGLLGCLNNNRAPHNWTVLWEPSSEAQGKTAGCWEVFHCFC